MRWRVRRCLRVCCLRCRAWRPRGCFGVGVGKMSHRAGRSRASRAGRSRASRAGHVSTCGRQISNGGNPAPPAGRPTDGPWNGWQQNGASHTADLTVSDETRQDQISAVDPLRPAGENTPPKAEPAPRPPIRWLKVTVHSGHPLKPAVPATNSTRWSHTVNTDEPSSAITHAHPSRPMPHSDQRIDPIPTTHTSTPNHLNPAATSARLRWGSALDKHPTRQASWPWAPARKTPVLDLGRCRSPAVTSTARSVRFVAT